MRASRIIVIFSGKKILPLVANTTRLTCEVIGSGIGAIIQPHLNDIQASGDTQVDGGRLTQVDLAIVQCSECCRRIHELAVYQDSLGRRSDP